MRAAAALAAALTLLASARAAAEALLPQAEAGLIAARAGWRYVPQSELLSAASRAGRGAPRARPGLPAVGAGLDYRIDRDWAVGFDFDLGFDRVAFADATSVDVQTLCALFAAERSLQVSARVELFLRAGYGWFLSRAEHGGRPGARTEGLDATGLFVGGGLRYAAAPDYGLVLENRYSFAAVPLDALGAASVGGNTVSLGVYWVVRSEQRIR